LRRESKTKGAEVLRIFRGIAVENIDVADAFVAWFSQHFPRFSSEEEIKAFFHWSWLLPLQQEVFMSPAKEEFAAWLTERFPDRLKVESFSQEYNYEIDKLAKRMLVEVGLDVVPLGSVATISIHNDVWNVPFARINGIRRVNSAELR
jgi:hypothetical protein